MTALIRAAELFCVAAFIFQLASIVVVIARVRRPDWATFDPNAAVSIIRPVCGIERFCEATLASSFHLAYPRYEVIFCVASSADPAIPLISRLIAANPG